MRVRIHKWGNSLALRIPKPFAAEARLGPGTAVDLSVRDGRLVASRVASRPTLHALLARVRPDNLHGEHDFGPGTGTEVW